MINLSCFGGDLRKIQRKYNLMIFFFQLSCSKQAFLFHQSLENCVAFVVVVVVVVIVIVTPVNVLNVIQGLMTLTFYEQVFACADPKSAIRH